MMKEKTIQKEISWFGIGLHSGQKIHLKLNPAPPKSGIVFVRKDLGGISIPVHPASILSTSFSTTIGVEGATVQTVEHLLAALSALEIDNALIELDGGEVPILDGSSSPFVSLLLDAGIVPQEGIKSHIELVKPISVSEQGKSITIHPAASFQVSYRIEFDHPLISTQSYFYRHSQETFVKEIAGARTFGFLKDVQLLQKQGLALGGSLENAIILDSNQILNKEGLRFPDEFVRHKILDLLGDLSLLGMPILGRVEAHCSGHRLHSKLIQEFLSNKKAWKVVQGSASSEKPRVHPSYQTAPSALFL